MHISRRPTKGSGLITLLIISLIVASVVVIFSERQTPAEMVPISTVQDLAEQNQLAKLTVADNRITAELIDGTKREAIRPAGESLADLGLSERNIVIEAVDSMNRDFWLSVIAGVIPFVLIALFLIFMMRSAQNSAQGPLAFSRSNPRVASSDKKVKTTFADVAGAQEAKEELIEVVDFLKSPKKYLTMGAKIPKGVLMVGPPGTGKTLLARAVAGEANVPFFSISGSEFVEMFVGVGASRVRDLFQRAKRNAPSIVFVDEIDAVGRQRGAGLGGGHDEREQTLNQILTEMDGFEKGQHVIVMAATNRPDVLDPALLRPGRFDRRVVIDAPDLPAREEILEVHGRNKPLAKKVDLKEIAKATPGCTGADLENILNEAAISAARENKKVIGQEHIVSAIEKEALGPARKSRLMSEDERRITAIHEMGHAIVGHALAHTDPIHKITIVSRGMANGVTWSLPKKERTMATRARFMDELAQLLGGRVAEEIIFGDITTGASNDIERATKIARSMVTEYGMSSLGPISYGHKHGSVFLGRELGEQRNYSEDKAEAIDTEVSSIVSSAHAAATRILKKHKGKLLSIADALLKKETLEADEFEKLMGIKKPTPKTA